MINNDARRPSGEAVVKLSNKEDLEEALKCERRTLENRIVVLEETDSETYNKHIKHVKNSEEDAIIHLKGLDWSASEDDIKNFLHDCKVKKVVIKINETGRPSGDDAVYLDSLADIDRQYLGKIFVIIE